MLKNKYLLTFYFTFLVGSVIAQNHTKTPKKPLEVTIEATKVFQKIEHFGASDAWSCQFVGNWPDAKKNAIADLLFSQDTLTNGQPKGIGLSLWRFNIGAGSTEQGDQSGIKDEWRRAESFLTNDGTYNWGRQAGQVWFLEAAKKRNVDKFLAFTNSPPVQFTINKKAFATAGQSNLGADQFDNFATFLVDVTKGIQQKTGIIFDYISPANEPQWDWSDGGQEGTPFHNHEIAQITKTLSTKLIQAKLPTKINIAEAGQLDFLYSAHQKASRGNQIDAFFKADSPSYIGNLPNVTNAISGHSYFTSSPFSEASSKRKQLAEQIASVPSLSYWMSEYCILGDNAGEIVGEKKDLGITSALYVAKTIHNDLVNGNASAWHWWTSISAYDYKDGLVYIDKAKTDGNFSASKLLWGMGNFSRFIRPGAERIASSIKTSDTTNSLLVSAYKDLAQKQFTTVMINTGDTPITVKMAVKNLRIKTLRPFITSSSSDLAPNSPIGINQSINIPARSIVTLVGKIG